MWRDMIERDARFSLGDALDLSEGEFREEFIDYWGLEAAACPEWLTEDDWLECRRLYGLAKQLAGIGVTLLRRKGVGQGPLSEAEQLFQEAKAFQRQVEAVLEHVDNSELRTELKTLIELPFRPSDPRTRRSLFQNALELEAAAALPYSPGRMADRLRTLAQYVVSTNNDRTIGYLSRVARCYCLDHRPELAVMCRAVLGTALEDIAPDEQVRAKLGGKPTERVGLAKRLMFIDALDLVTGEPRAAMDRLKKAGDDAAHVTPGLEPDSDELLRDLSGALAAIARIRDRPF